MRNLLVAALVILFASFIFAQTQQPRPGLIVLPLQAGAGLNANESDIGFAVQNVIEGMLVVHGGIDYQSLPGRQQLLFASADDLLAWVRGKPAAKSPSMDAISAEFVLRGRVERAGDTLQAKVELWNRGTDKRVTRDLAIDLPDVVSFRLGMLEVLRDARVPPTTKQTEFMLWKENISLPALRLLAEGVGGDLLAIYNDKPPSTVPLQQAVNLSPDSYLVRNWLGWLKHRNQQFSDAKESFAQANRINPAGPDALDGLGDCALRDKDLAAAETYARRKAELRGEPAARQFSALYQRAASYAWDAGDYKGAISYYEQLLPIERQLGDPVMEAAILSNLGVCHANMGQYEEAIDKYQQALTIQRRIHDDEGIASTLNNLGGAYEGLSNYDAAITAYEQALAVPQKVRDPKWQATTLSNIGAAYEGRSEYAKAIGFYERALTIWKNIYDAQGMVATLNNLGAANDKLGLAAKSLENYGQALVIAQRVHDSPGQATSLSNLGTRYARSSQYEEAIKYYTQALAMEQHMHDVAGEGTTFNDMGMAYNSLGQYETALARYESALALHRKVGNRRGEATTLNNMAGTYGKMGDWKKEVEYYEQALILRRQVKDRSGEAYSLANLMVSKAFLGQPRRAIHYGKEAVNVLHGIRGDLRDLPREARKSYVASNAHIYRNLATLLAQQGRVWEAEQVLLLLKEEETFEFIGEASKTGTSGIISFSPDEQVAAKQDHDLTEKLIHLAERAGALKSMKTHTADEQKELAQVQQQIETEKSAYVAFLNSLDSEFDKPETEADVAIVDRSRSIASHLEPGTVAVYTIASDNSYISLFITPKSAVVREVPITYGELDAKVKSLRQALMDKSADPRTEAQQLYEVMVGPIAGDIASARASTILWSLDGPIRHVPVAALYDGKQYLIEKYKMAMFSSVRAAGTRAANWDALALGVSKEHKVNGIMFPQLLGVPNELRAIVRGKDSPRGVLPGVIKLDDQFTWGAAKGELKQQSYTVVHIASHFEFNKERLASSFLLLGDGSALPLNELRNEGGLFRNVDLLALSACNTATEGDGREVDSFAKIVQDQGAASVLATLWPVYDPSTSQLMSRFYALHESSPTMTKAEALREAQLALLHGSNAAAPSSDKPVKRSGNRAESPEGDNRSARLTGAPTETRGSGKPNDYSHPYYWAPFILMGSWK